MKEIWKPVIGWEDLYEVSNKGRVKTNRREFTRYRNGNAVKCIYEEIIRKCRSSREGYRLVTLKRKTPYYRETTAKIHRLVAEAFIPNPKNKPCVNHIDSNKSNNSLQNLEWCTKKENTIHATNAGRIKKNPLNGKFVKTLFNL